MAVYMVFIRESEVHDAEEMAKYQNRPRGDISQYHLKPLAVYGKMEAIEGKAPDGMVILEFPTAEDARAWYYSDEYQEAAQHRLKAADYRAILLEGL